jgi:hypothetical protein
MTIYMLYIHGLEPQFEVDMKQRAHFLPVPYKVVPVLNYVPRHEDVLGRGGIAPRILDLGTRWR